MDLYFSKSTLVAGSRMGRKSWGPRPVSPSSLTSPWTWSKVGSFCTHSTRKDVSSLLTLKRSVMCDMTDCLLCMETYTNGSRGLEQAYKPWWSWLGRACWLSSSCSRQVPDLKNGLEGKGRGGGRGSGSPGFNAQRSQL